LIRRMGDREFCSTEIAGKYYSVEDIMKVLERERIFMNHSKGGVTFTGGEPMVQAGFLRSVLEACKMAGYHTAVDTSGYSSTEDFRSILPFTDLFLYDIKHLDDQRHIAATGVSNALILQNWRFLLENAMAVTLRIPVIPGFNDDNEHMARLIQFIMSTRTSVLNNINLLPFHSIGMSKYRRMKVAYRMEGVEPPSQKYMSELRNNFLGCGLKVKIGG